MIALSALPVKEIDGELTTLLALPPEEGGYSNDPILGLVENIGLEGRLLDGLEIYVGVLAATILFIATNAGVIGASRITYSMASYRQMPEVFRRLHPKFKTPWLSLVVFAGIAPIIILLPGDVNFVGTLYSLGATLSFTVAHVSLVRIRMDDRQRAEPPVYTAFPNLRARGVEWPLFAIVGGIATGISFLVIVAQNPPTRWVGLGWIVVGLVGYVVYRRRFLRRRLRETVKAPPAFGPALALEYRRLLVPVIAGQPSDDALDVACSLAAERGARIVALNVLEVPLDRPLDADLAELEDAANDELDEAIAIGDSYGVRVLDRLVRARSAGPAIVEEAEQRGSEIIVIGTPRKALTRSQRAVFGRTVDYVLRHAPVPRDGDGVARRGARMIWYRRAILVFSGVLRPDRPGAARRHGRQRRRARRLRPRRPLRRPRRRPRSSWSASVARKVRGFERVLDAPALFAVAYDEIGSSIYFALGIVAAQALGLTPVVLLATGLLFLVVSLSYAEGTAAIPETGGAATFTRRAFNDLVGLRHRLGAVPRLPDRDRALDAVPAALPGRLALGAVAAREPVGRRRSPSP